VFCSARVVLVLSHKPALSRVSTGVAATPLATYHGLGVNASGILWGLLLIYMRPQHGYKVR